MLNLSLPKALIYPLTVASKSSAEARRNAANKILNKMKEHSESLVNQESRTISLICLTVKRFGLKNAKIAAHSFENIY